MKKLGAHLSIAGGYPNALEKITAIDGNCLQIFSTSPRTWNKATITTQTVQQFQERKKKLAIEPIYFHASYLINLADPGETGRRSKASLIHELSLTPQLGIKGSIVHLGSLKNNQENYPVLIANLREVLHNSPIDTLLIIENAGSRKIGTKLEEIAKIIKDVDDKRLRVCLDTCHLHAAGYDLSSRKKLNTFLNRFNELIGLNRLELFHMNDSRDGMGSNRDRHENIGKGTIGIETFRLLLTHPITKHLPFIIETPGFDQKGPDKKNLDILKSLISS